MYLCRTYLSSKTGTPRAQADIPHPYMDPLAKGVEFGV